MAQYPTSVPSFSTVTSSTPVASSLLNNIYNELIAIATKVGADSSAVTSSHDYKLSGITGTEKAASDADLTAHEADTSTHGVAQIAGMADVTSAAATAAAALAAHEADTSTHGVSQVAGISDIPVKATDDEAVAGTNDSKFITPLAGVPYMRDGMYRQAIINGNFDISQRWGTGAIISNPADNTYIFDRWLTSVNNDSGTPPTTINHANAVLTLGDVFGSYIGYKVSPNGAGSGYGVNAEYGIRQKIEHGTRFMCGASKTVTLSFYAKTNISGKKLAVHGIQYYGAGGSPSSAEILTGTVFNLTSSWAQYTCTLTTNTLVGKTFGTNLDDSLQIQFNYVWGSTFGSSRFGAGSAETWGASGDIYIAQVQLCAGDVALPFVPKSYHEEMQLCRRYFYKLSCNLAASNRLSYGIGRSTTVVDLQTFFPVQMRIAPTLGYSTISSNNFVVSDTGTATNVTALALLGSTASPDSCIIQATVASGLTQYRPYFLESGNSNDVYLTFNAEL